MLQKVISKVFLSVDCTRVAHQKIIKFNNNQKSSEVHNFRDHRSLFSICRKDLPYSNSPSERSQNLSQKVKDSDLDTNFVQCNELVSFFNTALFTIENEVHENK